MPKLQKRQTKSNDPEAYSYSVTLPKDYIEKVLKWKKGEDLIIKLSDNRKRLIIESIANP